MQSPKSPRDKHYPDEIRLLLKKFNTDPQSMTTKESQVLVNFSIKEEISLEELLGTALQETPVVSEPTGDSSAPLQRRKSLFEGKFYDFVCKVFDIEFGYNITDNPYEKAGELIREHGLNQSLDDTLLRTQIANAIQETVRKKAGEHHLDRMFPDEERIRATEEEKKEYQSAVRNANLMIQKRVMEDEARRKKARANVTNLIKLNQMRLRKTGEVRTKMVNGVLTRTRVPKGIPDEQLSAILLAPERKERLEARQERLKTQTSKSNSQSPSVRKGRKKRKGTAENPNVEI